MFKFSDRSRQIICRRKTIAPSLFIIQKRKIFTVIVLVAVIYIKTHTAEHFVHLPFFGTNVFRHIEQMPVIEIGLAMRRFQNRGKRQHVNPPAVFPVKPFCPEISRTDPRRKQTTLIDRNSALSRRDICLVFLLPDILRINAAGEFYDPILPVNANMRFWPRAAARTA